MSFARTGKDRDLRVTGVSPHLLTSKLTFTHNYTWLVNEWSLLDDAYTIPIDTVEAPGAEQKI